MLCPRKCAAKRTQGQRGVCGAGKGMRIARAALHFWEEPPISGIRGSGTVFFAHCPLQCAYCQNAQLARGDAGAEVSVARLAEICLELQEKQALNVNFVTPTHYSASVAQAVQIAREKGFCLPVVWNTSGYENAEVIEALAGTVDVFLTDYKYATKDLGKRYSNAPDYASTALNAIESMVKCAGSPRFDIVDDMPRLVSGVIVRHLVLPGAQVQSKMALKALYRRFGNDVLYSIMNQYTPVVSGALARKFPELGQRVSDEDYESVLDFADSLQIDDYYWQNGPAANESFIPVWDNEGVLNPDK